MLARVLNLNPDRIAVTELFGAIGSPARTTEFIRMLRAIEENNKIRALVFFAQLQVGKKRNGAITIVG